MKKITTGVCLVEQYWGVSHYLAIPKEYFDKHKLIKGNPLYARVAIIEGITCLEYSLEQKIASRRVSIIGSNGYYRLCIPKTLEYGHEKGSRYDAYETATGSLAYVQLAQ